MTSDLFLKVQTAAVALRDRIEERQPRAAFVLGSALGGFADRCEAAISVPYEDVPHVRTPTAAGHAGQFVSGTVEGLEVLVLSGRLHYYEGYALEDVTFPIRLVAALGIETVVLTNASGGVDPSFAAGDLMIIEDHVNLTGTNPLLGPNDDRLGTRFPDMTNLYDPELRTILGEVADACGVAVRRGVYAGLSGPSYETPAEVRMLAVLGAHAVGMSTVPEAIVARHAGLRVAGISCITNAAAGHSGSPLSHTEVMATAARSASAFEALLAGLCGRLSA
jgi:purine-nucleoside phosphorylase